MTTGAKLSVQPPLPGEIIDTDIVYVVRGLAQYKGTGAQLRIIADQITDATTIGKALLQAANVGAARTTLALGTLATLAAVGTTEITDQAVTLAKWANLSENNTILGDASNRPVAYATGATGRAVLAAADESAAFAALALGTLAAQDADQVEITGGSAIFTGPPGSALLAAAGAGEVAIGDGIVDVGEYLAYRGALLVGAPAAAITDPTGGATVDAEARTALIALLDALRVGGAHGLIAV